MLLLFFKDGPKYRYASLVSMVVILFIWRVIYVDLWQKWLQHKLMSIFEISITSSVYAENFYTLNENKNHLKMNKYV